MKKRTLVAAALAVVFVLALAAPAFAMTHSATYEWDGTVDMEKQVGHLCNTGAEMKQDITGDGKMDKTMDVDMSKGILTVDDKNDFVTAEDAVDNLTVTSVIELCAPAKQEYATTNYVYGEDGWEDYVDSSGVADLKELYDGTYDTGDLQAQLIDELDEDADNYEEMKAAILAADDLEDMTKDEINTEFGIADFDNYTVTETNALTSQLWAVQVEANPGMSGNVHQEFEAAYGDTYSYDNYTTAEGYTGPVDGWGTVANPTVTDDYTVARGSDYVGNYFHMDQWARTSDGTLKRFIDISSPFTHAYLMEDMEVTGESEVEEAFTMDNIAAGEDMDVTWYDLFY